jgi:hypothetical protein
MPIKKVSDQELLQTIEKLKLCLERAEERLQIVRETDGAVISGADSEKERVSALIDSILMADREVHTIELTEEINELCRQPDQPARYVVNGEEVSV